MLWRVFGPRGLKVRRFPYVGLALAVGLIACGRFGDSREHTVTPTMSTPTVVSSVATVIADLAPASSPTVVTRPTPTSTPLSGRAPTGTPEDFKTHRDKVFGFEISYPPDWAVAVTSEPPELVQIGATEQDGAQSLVFLIYNSTPTSADAVVDSLLPQFLDRSGFRQLSEEELTIEDGTLAYKIVYEWRDTGGMRQGNIFGIAQGAKSFIVVTDAPKEVYEARTHHISAFLRSFRFVKVMPLGIPRDQALTIYFDDGPLTLDPAIANDMQSVQYIAQVFSGLLGFDRDLNLTADLASEWRISNNGTIYTFTLQENARFHNGRSVTASDVKYSWERAGSLAKDSAAATTYLNDIVGMKKIFGGHTGEAVGIEVLGNRTLRVTIDAPKPYFLSKLTHSATYVVDQNNVAQGHFWWTKPNGTGPFKLKEWDFTTLFVLESNRDYYRGPPQVPFVVFRLYGGFPVLMYESGETDITTIFGEDAKKAMTSNDKLHSEMVTIQELAIYYVGFAIDKPPFDDPMVRKAFTLAVDREKLVEEFFGNTGQVAHGFLPPGLPGYDTSIPDILFDPDEARRLLADSSYGGPDGLPPILYTTANVGGRASARVESLLDMWNRNLGVKVGVRLLDADTYLYALRGRIDNMFDHGWVADYPSPQNFLDILFRSGAKNNLGKYSSPEGDALLDKAQVEQNEDQRLELYRHVERLLVRDSAAIPLNFGRSYLLVKPYVKDMITSPFGHLDLRHVSLVRH